MTAIQDVIKKLALIAHCWRDPNYVLRQQAIACAAQEFCLSPASFTLALDWIFAQWTETNIQQAFAHNPFRHKPFNYAVQILAGTTPAMIAQGFLQGVILNIPQCLKIPSKQPTFARILYQSFIDNELTPLFELSFSSTFYTQLAHADFVIAYGSDETMATLKQHLAPNALFITHGHVESAAIIFKEAANTHCLKKLADDMLSYDQRGCLSPRVTFIEQGGALSPAMCAQIFSEEILPHAATQLPRGGLFPGEAAEILHQRSVYGFRGQVYTGADWTVCYDETLLWPTASLPRFMPIKSFANSQDLLNLLKKLICLGYAGDQENIRPFKTLTKHLCPLGEMQKQWLVF